MFHRRITSSLLIAVLFSLLVPNLTEIRAQQLDDREELRILIETGEYQEAIDWVEEETGVYPLLAARAYRETGRLADALEVLKKSPGFLRY